jgi:hypothetical protein
VRADQVRDGVVRQHHAPHVVGAEIEPDAIAHREDRTVAPGRERDRVHLVARVRGAIHMLAPALDPFHGPAEHTRRDRDQRVLRVP